jgi:hypothetical protein
MPADATHAQLKALIRELHPRRSDRDLSIAAGLKPGRIGYHLKATTRAKGMPFTVVMEEIARAVACDLAMVVKRCADDAGLPWGFTETDARQYLTPDERLLVKAYRQCRTDEARKSLLHVAQAMASVS